MAKIYEKNNNKLIFSANADESLANAIRRSVNEIPILAIDEVEFIKNDSVLYDEILAHRLGLIPLKNDKSLKEPENCSCDGEGCSKCQVKLKLEKVGPAEVLSGDLKGSVDVVYEGMPLTILREGQEIELVATATLGKGIKHSKHSPGILHYREFFEGAPKKSAKLCKDCLNAITTQVISTEGKEDEEMEFERHVCKSCGEEIQNFINKNKENLDIPRGEGLLFFIDSFGQISAEEILKESISALKKNLTLLSKK